MNHHLDQEVVAGFISEAKGYLPEIMLGLEAFAAAPEHHESIKEAFRYAHIIKGAASMLGFNKISELAYQLEVRLEKLCEQQMTLSQELLEELCQTVSDLSDLLETSLEEPPSFFPPAQDYTSELPVLPISTVAPGVTDFDFFFTSLPETDQEEKGQTHLLETPKLAVNNLTQTPSAIVPAESDKEEAMLSFLDNTDFSVSLPEAADATTVGELNLSKVAAELKESFGNTPPPPQPEFPLPNELMSALPDFQFERPPAALPDDTDVLEVSDNCLPDVSYNDLADDLAANLLSDAPAPVPEPAFLAPAPAFDLPAPTPVEEALLAEASAEIPELLPLPELPELLAHTAPEMESLAAEPAVDESNEVSPYQFDDFLPEAPIVETPTAATSPLPQDLPEELLEIFLVEAEEHLQIMQTALRALEKRPDAIESLQGMRRSAHSLKGTAALVGFRNIMQLAHRMEDLLDLVYEAKFALTSNATHLLMRATDMLEDMSTGQVDEAALQHIYAEFDLTLAEGEALAELATPTQSAGAEEPLVEPELSAEIIVETTIFDLVEEQSSIAHEEELPVAELFLPEVVAEPVQQETVLDATTLLNEMVQQETICDEAVLPAESVQQEIVLDQAMLSDETMVPAFESFSDLPDELVMESEIGPEAALATPAQLIEPIAEQETEAVPEPMPESSAEAEAEAALEAVSEPTFMESATEKSRATLPAPSFPAILPAIETALPLVTTAPAVAEAPISQEEPSVAPTAPGTPAQTSGQFLRVPIEHLDEVVKLIGEMIITRTAFEQRLADFAHQVEELQIAGARLRRASTDLESKYEASSLGGDLGSLLPGKLLMGASASGVARSLVMSHTHGFDDLEFDRYTEFHLVSRELVEASSDIQTVGREFAHLNGDFLGYLNRQSRIYNELQDRLMRLRMVPLASIGQRLHRAVRQVSTHENKLVELTLEGEATAIDTTALQDLVDPLVHLLRNAVDHGIESPAARVAAGKPATGRITLRAFYEGSQVILQLSDDGKGLDSEKIRAKAIQHGLISGAEAESLSQAELWSLIFTPGFSTASQVSEISGRGMGMDVVQTTVQKLKGTITIDSRPNAGVTFTIRLPLTLAVTRALMVKAHGQHFAIPLDVVTQIMRLDTSKVERIGKEPIVRIGGKIYPLLMLSRLLNLRQLSDEILARPPALLINVEGKEVVVIVDQLMGGREIVVKTLGTHLRNVHGVMGATLMGSGDVVLILNLAELVRGTTRTTGRRPAIIAPAAPTAKEHVETVGEGTSWVEELAPNIKLSAGPPISRPKTDPQTLTVMIVDDSPSVRRVGANLIKNTGWVPVQAKDGLDALEKLQAGEVKPDLMMLDIEMPRMDGYQLLASLRTLPAFRQLPIVIVSSRASEKHRQKAFDLGATDYLVKPYQEDYVVNLIRRLVKKDNQ